MSDPRATESFLTPSEILRSMIGDGKIDALTGAGVAERRGRHRWRG